MFSKIRALVEPKSVVLVGASELEGEDKIYSELFSSLIDNLSNFRGKIHVVDLSGKLEKSERGLDKIPKERDLAVILLPDRIIAKNLQKLTIKNFRAITIIGRDIRGKTRDRILKLVERKKLTLLGPDSIGVINTSNGLIAVSRGDQVFRGCTAIVSQDHSVACAILELAQHVGISKFINVDRSAGVDETEILNFLVKDKETKAICVYVEKVRNGRKIVEAIKGAIREKPVVILKGGGDFSGIFSAALKQAGAIQVHDIKEMLNVADGLAKQPPMHGDRVAVITNFIGQAKLLEKYILEEKLTVARLSEESIKRINKKFPSVAVDNFITLGLRAKAGVYRFIVETLLSDKNVDGVIAIISNRTIPLEPAGLQEIAEVAEKSGKKPLIGAIICMEDYAAALNIAKETKLPIYTQLDEAARVLRTLRTRGEQLRKISKSET